MVESPKELRRICYHGHKVFRPWYNKHFSNKVSIYVTWLLLHTGITPNQVSLLEIFLVITGAIFMFTGSLLNILVGILIIHFTVILDCCDGEIARYRSMSSKSGMFLEDFYHAMVSHLMFFAVAFGAYIKTGWTSVLIFGFLASVFSKSIVIETIFSTVMKIKLEEKVSNEKKGKSKLGKASAKQINLQGSSAGKSLSDLYSKLLNFWGDPAHIVYLTIISIIEYANWMNGSRYFMSYSVFYWFIVAYGAGSVVKQIISFVVHYNGKAVEQYYKSVFGDR
ncbi:CDP-alcohol phosphatidyltransferase family protein [Candidatus Woesearchaeota archaeon]|nr:CDP-alcohol phosphatidyltransferase family protein [Candidatus Woesearchaeota archaeon]